MEKSTWFNLPAQVDKTKTSAGGSAQTEIPVLTEYPETSPELAGTRFWYKGNEWHYMTQDEIDSTGWTGLVEVGFPAPVNKIFNRTLLVGDNVSTLNSDGIYNVNFQEYNALGFGYLVNKSKRIQLFTGGIETKSIKNFHLLSSLEDVGTGLSFILSSPFTTNFPSEVLNDLFTQLPPTNKVATLDVKVASGAATCDPTIATAKGYTVITS